MYTCKELKLSCDNQMVNRICKLRKLKLSKQASNDKYYFNEEFHVIIYSD